MLVDEELKPWLLEVNLSPSLSTDSPLDLKIKSTIICDLFNMIGILDCKPTRSKNFNPSKRTRRLAAERSSPSPSPSPFLCSSENGKHLSRRDKALLQIAESEYKHKGGYQLIFPAAGTWQQYLPFMDRKHHLYSTMATRLQEASTERDLCSSKLLH